MRKLPWLALGLVAAGCASTGGAAPGDGEPRIMYRVTERAGPHPVVRIPWQDAQAMGIYEPAFAPPGFADALVGRCDDSNHPVECRRDADLCRWKTCTIVPVQ